MRVTTALKLSVAWAAARARLASESGFTMVVALGVLAVTSLLVGAVYMAVKGDVHLSQKDLAAQQAYYAARAGENAFLYQLNQNPNYWSTCANDYQPNAVSVPGSATGAKYSWVPVYNPGYSNSNCTPSNIISAVIDGNTGTLRMEFTGYAGTPNSSGVPSVTRTVVASFKKPTPLDYLWYTDHELEDPQLNGNCANERYYWQYTPMSSAPSSCQINWISGDTMRGPSYTNDLYLIYPNASPTFGRSGTNDQTLSSAQTSSVCVSGNCQRATFLGGGAGPKAKPVQMPQSVSSTQLKTDALANGQVFTGTTSITLTGTTATISNCPGTTFSASCTNGWVSTLESTPSIIYVQSASGCPSTYSLNTSYSTNSSGHYYGPCGDVYVHGTYSQPLTIVADHDIIVVANNGGANPGIVNTSTDGSGNPTGTSTLGLVAGDFVRVMHSSGTNVAAVAIHAAILTLSHSFMVDNYGSGGGGQPGLTIHGAIAQRYRGIVGTAGGTGYLKNYYYDDRLHVILPPYLFDLATAGWNVVRETLCSSILPASNSGSCAYTGT